METFIQPEAAPDDRHQHIDGDRDPDLSLHRILRRSEERLDPQVLLDPLEEQFYLPSCLVQFSDGQGRQDEVVGQKHQGLVSYPVDVLDAAQLVWISSWDPAGRPGRRGPRWSGPLPLSTVA